MLAGLPFLSGTMSSVRVAPRVMSLAVSLLAFLRVKVLTASAFSPAPPADPERAMLAAMMTSHRCRMIQFLMGNCRLQTSDCRRKRGYKLTAPARESKPDGIKTNDTN